MTNQPARGIDCVYYLAKDLERAIAFYRDNLGFGEPTRFGTGAIEWELADGNAFGLAVMPDGNWVKGGGAVFAVDDAAAAVETLRKNGVEVYGTVMETPVCWSAWCGDSEGNSFAVHQRKR
jgi:predicted enzyme related to lactoylglutathione lyase